MSNSASKNDPVEFIKSHSAAMIFSVLIAICAFVTPHFWEWATARNTLVQVFPVMTVALGMTLVISSGGIDISVGAIMAIAAATAAVLFTSCDVGLSLAIGCGLVAGALCGVFNGVLISRFKIQPIIVTLIVMIAGRGLAMRINGGVPKTTLVSTFNELGLYKIADVVPIQIVIMTITVAIMLFVANKTVFAKQVEAVGDNSRAARLVGINTLLTAIGVYAIGGVLCAIAGIMHAAWSGSLNVNTLGLYIELDVIAAVAIGGTPFSGGRARILGTVAGAIVIGLVTVVATMNGIDDQYSMIFKAVILVVAMWTQREK